MDTNDKYIMLMDGFINIMMPAFIENIPEAEAGILCMAFADKIKKDFANVIRKAAENPHATVDRIISVFGNEMQYWRKLSLDEKKSLLIADSQYQELESLSNEAFHLAEQRMKDSIVADKKDRDRIKSGLDDRILKVAQYNKNKADELYSEALVDLSYAGNATDNKSLRLGRFS